jgi:DNA-binding helix-hairpin-helix protein with protein kinase domain
METGITQFRFAYSTRRSETRMEPPPNVPLLTDIPQNIANAFEIAFGPPGVSVGRPKPANWIELLENAEKNIVRCKTNAAHQHFQSANSCPWCAMEKAYPGFIAFPPTFPTNLGTPVDLGQLIAAINAVQDPGIANPLRSLMPLFAGSPTPLPAVSNSNWKSRYIGGLVVALCSLELLYLDNPAPLVGVIALGGSVWWSFRQWDVVDPFQKKTAQIARIYGELERKWTQASDNRSFQEARGKANECIKQFQSLGPQETKEITDLKLQQREQQLTRFLERFHIQHATIKELRTPAK